MLGFDEAWIGEHHSYGRELIADPAVFIAAAAVRTKRIKLGTGVTSLPYHHPLMVADKMTLLDHMTEGRAMLGVGPGALTSDAYMLGIDPVVQRPRMNEALDAIMALFKAEEPVNVKTDWFEMKDARLQLAAFSEPHLPVAVATTFTPSGPSAAGRHGLGLLSVAGAGNEGFERTWGWAEEAAAESGHTVDRGEWKVVVPFHLADSRQEAFDGIREGFARQAYVGDRNNPIRGTATGLPFAGGTLNIEEALENGALIVGTPDDAIAAIERLQERSGGIGGVLGLAHEWSNTERNLHSFELWARFVSPKFQGQLGPIEASRDYIEARAADVFGGTPAALARAFTDAGKPLPAAMQAQFDAALKAREEAAARGPQG
jgi:limonene 1,2-monooxygenase